MDNAQLIQALREPCMHENCILSWQAADAIDKLTAELEQAKRERDMAIRDLAIQSGCWNCKNNEKCPDEESIEEPIVQCTNYEWRGAGRSE